MNPGRSSRQPACRDMPNPPGGTRPYYITSSTPATYSCQARVPGQLASVLFWMEGLDVLWQRPLCFFISYTDSPRVSIHQTCQVGITTNKTTVTCSGIWSFGPCFSGSETMSPHNPSQCMSPHSPFSQSLSKSKKFFWRPRRVQARKGYT